MATKSDMDSFEPLGISRIVINRNKEGAIVLRETATPSARFIRAL